MNYESIKEIARQIRGRGQKCQVTDLIALAPQNDPFYTGTETDIKNGKWFQELWERFGYSGQVHLRRIHYQIISQQEPVLMPNGQPYENTLNCWNFLELASKAARYLDYVDPEQFVDRRNPDPHLYLNERPDELQIDVTSDLGSWTFAFPSEPEPPNFSVYGFTGEQRYHLEIWCEKSTMNDVLLPLCEQYRVNLVTGVGEQSITSTIALIKRALASQKPVRVFYVSDFDPAGRSMPVAVARKAEYYIKRYGDQVDFKLFPLVLTQAQCADYELPRTPIKDTEKRKGHFEDTFGQGATELDALEALHPGTLGSILEEHILNYYDETLTRRCYDARELLHDRLAAIREEILHPYQEQLDALHQEYQQIRTQYHDLMQGYIARCTALHRQIEDDLQRVSIDDSYREIPEAEERDEIGAALFDSGRNYLEQLHIYKEFQGKSNGFGGITIDLEV